MTYPLIVAPFMIVTLLVTLATRQHPRFAERMASSGLTALVLVGLTLVFDNLMIAADLFSYPDEHLSGWKLGLAPIEDFAYPLCAAFLVPALFTLFSPRNPRPADSPTSPRSSRKGTA